MNMSEESLIAESYSNLKSAILLGRTDIVRGILSTAAESRLENGFFDDEEDEENGEDFRIKKWDEDYEDNPYDLLRVILNYVDDDAGSALHLATKLGNSDITRALLSAGADPTKLNKEGVTPFEYCTEDKILRIYNEQVLEAAAHNQLSKLQKLLAAGVSANATDGTDSNNTALHWASTFGSHESVKVLCEHGADPNAVNSRGATPLLDGLKRHDSEILKVLLSYGAKPDVPLTAGGKTMIELAPEGSEIKQLLLFPPERVTVEKTINGVDGPLSESVSDIVEEGSNSSETNGPVVEKVNENKNTADSDSSPSSSDVTKKVEESKPPSRSELDLDLLWPYPQQLTLIKGHNFFPEAYLSVKIVTRTDQDPHCVQDMWRVVEDSFKTLGYSVRTLFISEFQDNNSFGDVSGSVVCSICPLLFTRSESYSIHVSSRKISLCASEPKSLWYGINTLLQLFKLAKGVGIPQMQINDWPDLKYRAALIDVGHGRTLHSDSLLFLVDVLSSLKYNQMVLSLPPSFGQTRQGTHLRKPPFSQNDILKLDRYCRKRYIELIPYMDHSSDLLCSNDGSKVADKTSCDAVMDMNSRICSSFPSSRFIHVGMNTLDEIATEASEEEKEGAETKNLLVDRLMEVNEHCKTHRKVSMFWANAFHDHLKQGKVVPRGCIAMEYGGKPGYDFRLFCKLCSDSGIPFYVCPGTLTWSSLVGVINDSVDLIDEAVQCAVNYNGLGVLVTDWTAYGNLTPIDISLPSFAAASALAWNSKMKQESVLSSLPKVLDSYVFHDEAHLFGDVLRQLSSVHSLFDPRPLSTAEHLNATSVLPNNKPENAYRILQLFMFPNHTDPSQLHSESIQKVLRCLRKSQSSLSKVNLKCRRSTSIIKMQVFLIDMALFACRVARALTLANADEKLAENSSTISMLPTITRTDLANRLLTMIENYQRFSEAAGKRGDKTDIIEQLQRIFNEIVPQSTLDV